MRCTHCLVSRRKGTVLAQDVPASYRSGVRNLEGISQTTASCRRESQYGCALRQAASLRNGSKRLRLSFPPLPCTQNAAARRTFQISKGHYAEQNARQKVEEKCPEIESKSCIAEQPCPHNRMKQVKRIACLAEQNQERLREQCLNRMVPESTTQEQQREAGQEEKPGKHIRIEILRHGACKCEANNDHRRDPGCHRSPANKAGLALLDPKLDTVKRNPRHEIRQIY